jgi:hypothetical protein
MHEMEKGTRLAAYPTLHAGLPCLHQAKATEALAAIATNRTVGDEPRICNEHSLIPSWKRDEGIDVKDWPIMLGELLAA